VPASIYPSIHPPREADLKQTYGHHILSLLCMSIGVRRTRTRTQEQEQEQEEKTKNWRRKVNERKGVVRDRHDPRGDRTAINRWIDRWTAVLRGSDCPLPIRAKFDQLCKSADAIFLSVAMCLSPWSNREEEMSRAK